MSTRSIQDLEAAEQAAYEAYQAARIERLALPEDVEHSVRVHAVEKMSAAYGAHECALQTLDEARRAAKVSS
jgi:hypothetical protein